MVLQYTPMRAWIHATIEHARRITSTQSLSNKVVDELASATRTNELSTQWMNCVETWRYFQTRSVVESALTQLLDCPFCNVWPGLGRSVHKLRNDLKGWGCESTITSNHNVNCFRCVRFKLLSMHRDIQHHFSRSCCMPAVQERCVSVLLPSLLYKSLPRALLHALQRRFQDGTNPRLVPQVLLDN
jgi:hypothetical protein